MSDTLHNVGTTASMSSPAPTSPGFDTPAPPIAPNEVPQNSSNVSLLSEEELNWVWKEVRKRVFVKEAFSRPVFDALEAIKPIMLDGDRFVCGFSTNDYYLSLHLESDAVQNVIESILRAAAKRPITFEVIEGTTPEDWFVKRDRRAKAQAAIIEMAATRRSTTNQVEDILNQIIAEIRQRVSATKDRLYPQVRAALVLEIAPILAAAEDMLFEEAECHESRRAVARALDRISGFLDVTPMVLAIEIERCRHNPDGTPRRALAPSASSPNFSIFASKLSKLSKANARNADMSTSDNPDDDSAAPPAEAEPELAD